MSEVNIELEVIKAEIAKLESELRDAKARAKALKPAAKSKAEPRPCACSCGGMTNGGTWLPGHDARYRSAMLTRIDNGDESAIDELLARPTLLHGATEADLRERLGSVQRQKDAAIEKEAARQLAREQREAELRADRKAAARLKKRSREEMFAAQERRLANKDRAVVAAKSGTMEAA